MRLNIWMKVNWERARSTVDYESDDSSTGTVEADNGGDEDDFVSEMNVTKPTTMADLIN